MLASPPRGNAMPKLFHAILKIDALIYAESEEQAEEIIEEKRVFEQEMSNIGFPLEDELTISPCTYLPRGWEKHSIAWGDPDDKPAVDRFKEMIEEVRNENSKNPQ